METPKYPAELVVNINQPDLEAIQAFLIEELREAWEMGYYTASDGEFFPEPGENPYGDPPKDDE